MVLATTVNRYGRCLVLCAGLWVGVAGSARGNEAPMNVPDSVQETQLANGLRVLIKVVPAVPVVSVFVWYRVGSRDEAPGQSGSAHFLEHMLFKGTAKFPKGEIARRVGRTGGEQNAFTSYDYTAYFETLPADQLDLALEIEADRMQRALLDPEEMEKERTVILSELEGYRNSPQVRLRDLVNAQTWVHHPYRRPVIGWREEVERLTVEQLRAFYRRHYRPDNATLVVVGDIKPADVQARIASWFGPLKGEGALLPRPEFPAETPQGERRALLRDFGQAALVRLQVPVPRAGDPEHFTLSVLNDVLTVGKTSRLYRALVDSGLAAEVNGAVQEMVDDGVWTFTATCQQGVTPERVEAVLRTELGRAAREPLTPREFQRAVNQTRANLIFARDSLTDQALYLGHYQTVAGDWRLLDRYPEGVAAVTPDQVRAAAAKYLSPDRMTIGQFLPVPGGRSSGGGEAPAADPSAWPRTGRDFAWESLPGVAAPAPGVTIPGQGGASSASGTTPPDPGGTSPGAGGEGRRFVFDNGLVLLVQPNPSNPTVHLSGLVRGGMAAEPEALPGLAYVHAQMLDRGTARRSAQQLAEDLEFHGASLEYAAGQEELNFTGSALASDLDLLVTALAETLTQPVFPEAELKKTRQEALTACRVLQDSAQAQAWQGFLELGYPEGHPLRRGLLRAEPGLRRLRRADLTAFQRRWMRPDLTIISLAGDVEPETVRRLVQDRLGAWRAVGERPVLDLVPMPPVTGTRERVLDLPGKRESITVFGHEGIRRQDPEYYDAFVTNHVLGGSGLSSLLMRTVRDRDGLTYGIYSQFRVSTGTRPWTVSFQSDPANVARAIETVIGEVRTLQAGEAREQDVDDAREELVGGLYLSLETNRGLAHLNREVEYHRLGEDYLRRYAEGVRAVDRERVGAAARKWFHPERRLVSVVRPPAAPVEAAPRVGPGEP